jgi:hypothetical protein
MPRSNGFSAREVGQSRSSTRCDSHSGSAIELTGSGARSGPRATIWDDPLSSSRYRGRIDFVAECLSRERLLSMGAAGFEPATSRV